MATRRITLNTPRENNLPYPNPPKPIRLTPKKLEDRREKGICFDCDNKYSKGHKCGEKKLFYIDYEEEETDDQEPSHVEETKETSLRLLPPYLVMH